VPPDNNPYLILYHFWHKNGDEIKMADERSR
jgi:hypothetical protein